MNLLFHLHLSYKPVCLSAFLSQGVWLLKALLGFCYHSQIVPVRL